MARLIRGNVEKEVPDNQLEYYLKQGFTKISVKTETVQEDVREEVEKVEKSLETMTVPELKEQAKEKGVEGYNSLTKPELIAVLKDVKE